MVRSAKLLFDSDLSAGVPGARALGGTERSLLYASDHLSIDMVMLDAGSGLQVIHGQVVDTRGSTRGVRTRVRLGVDGEPVETDAFGQFSVSWVEPAEDLVVVETIDGDIGCHVPRSLTGSGSR